MPWFASFPMFSGINTVIATTSDSPKDKSSPDAEKVPKSIAVFLIALYAALRSAYLVVMFLSIPNLSSFVRSIGSPSWFFPM